MPKKLHAAPNKQVILDNNAVGTTVVEDEEYIDLADIWRIVKRKFWILLMILLVSTIGIGLGKYYLQTTLYRSEAIIFLTPKVSSTGEVDQSSINSNKALLNNTIELVTQQNIMNQVAEEVGTMTPDAIQGTLSVSSVNNSELISISSTTTNPELSQEIAQSTTNVFIETMKDNLNLQNITVVSQPELSYIPVSDSLIKCLFYGFAFGFIADAVYVVAYMFLNRRLQDKEQAEEYLNIPVLVVVPDLGDL